MSGRNVKSAAAPIKAEPNINGTTKSPDSKTRTATDMTSRANFAKDLLVIGAVFGGLAAGLYAILGPQLFSFYGWAASAAVGALGLSRALRRRFLDQGLSRWPRLLFLIPALLTCIIQIGYWLAFFHLGGLGRMLGQVRLMLLPELGVGFWVLLSVLLLIATLLVARGLRPDRTP